MYEFNEPSALIFFVLIILGLFFTVINPSLKDELNLSIRILLLFSALLILLICWLIYRFRLPRFREKKKIGIILSIFSENEKDLLQMKYDVISKIKKGISQDDLSDSVGILIIPNHLSKKIITSKEIANAHSKTKGHFFIQGHIKKRSEEGEKNFVELEGRVVHAPVDINISKKLSGEFRESLPPEIVDDPNFQIRQIKITSDTIAESSKYIIGIAALISGDPLTAINLHERLLSSLEAKEQLTESEKNLKQKTINNLAFENMILANHYLMINDENNFQIYFDNAKKYNPDEYGVLLASAIEKFRKGDIVGSKEDVMSAKKLAFGRQDWRYSESFLHYWSDEFQQAYEASRRISQSGDIGKERIAQQVILFNLDLIKKNNKPQLKFWVAYLYYKCLNNITMSHKYFSEFIQEASESNMGYLTEKAKIFLGEIESKMSIEKS